MWVYLHLIVEDCIGNEEKEVPATALAQRWLEAVKRDNKAILQQKGAISQTLLEELAVLAADLPLACVLLAPAFGFWLEVDDRGAGSLPARRVMVRRCSPLGGP
jgi:hypothetical protein